MKGFEQLLAQITSEYSALFYTRQVITILVLFLYGYAVCKMLFYVNRYTAIRTQSGSIDISVNNAGTAVNAGIINNIYHVLLAFPLGLSVFGVCGIILLITGIKYCVLSVVVAMAAVFIGIMIAVLKIIKKRNGKAMQTSAGTDNRLKFGEIFKSGFDIKYSIIIAAAVIVLVLISVSGIISLGFTNDSMYYYSEYPRAIVLRGGIYYGFDTNLTDAGQTTALINTLPYLFGFDEAFGIHTFFNINFIVFFVLAIYEQASRRFDRKRPIAFSALFTMLLLTSMPFVLISKWNIANVYFMEQMFMCMYLFFKSYEENRDITPVMTILLMMLSFMRIEGSLYVALILLCVIALKKGNENSKIGLHNIAKSAGEANSKKTIINIPYTDIIIPAICVMLLQSLYFAKIFLFMKLLASYTFMTKQKALVIPLVFIAIIIYAWKFADKLKIEYNIAYIAALVLSNIAIFLYDRQQYAESLNALITNMRGSSGWGFFPAVVIALIILVPKVKIKTLYFDLFFICFALLSLIACVMRDGTLRVSFADSGNRVFMQIIPFIIYAFAYRFIIALHILSTSNNK